MAGSTGASARILPPMHAFEAKFAAQWPYASWSDRTVLLAVSGGPDSVALLRAMTALRTTGAGRLVVAHFNHRWRGAASDADQQFVAESARMLGLECQVGLAEPPAAADPTPKVSEAAARKVRYRFLEATARQCGARYVVTAHTLDDQAETVLQRIIRGTGIRGLGGIRRVRELSPGISLIRPLLGVRRSQVLAYLADLGQAARHDHTNDDTRYLRNRIRRRLLPLMADEFDPHVRESLVRLAGLAAETQTALDALLDERLEACHVRREPDRVDFDPRPLAAAPPLVLRAALIGLWRGQGWPEQAMGRREWAALAELVAEPTLPARVFPGAIRASWTSDGRFLLAEVRSPATLPPVAKTEAGITVRDPGSRATGN